MNQEHLKTRVKVFVEVYDEWLKQIYKGFDEDHDDCHSDGSLAAAASCYALVSSENRPNLSEIPENWPWDDEWWNPTLTRDNLVKAAALIIADIERIDRERTRTPF